MAMVSMANTASTASGWPGTARNLGNYAENVGYIF